MISRFSRKRAAAASGGGDDAYQHMSVSFRCYFSIFVRKLAFFGRLPALFGPLDRANLATSVFWFLNWTFATLQYSLLICISLNRSLAICCPRNYMQVTTQCCEIFGDF